MASPIDYRGSKPTNSQKKKKKKNQKSNPRSHRWQRKPNPNTVYTEQKQYKLQYCVYQKKKKSLCTKTKPKKTPILARRRRRSLARPSLSSLIACHSPLITNRFGLVLGAPSLKVFLSLFLSDSLSVSLSLSH